VRSSSARPAQLIVGIIRARCIRLRYPSVGEEMDAVAVVVLATSVPMRLTIGGRIVLNWVCSALGAVPGVIQIVVAPLVGVADQPPAGLGAGVTWCRPEDGRLSAIRSALRTALPSASVLVHEADQPMVTARWLSDVLAVTAQHPALASGTPVKAAYKQVADGMVQQTVPRDRLVHLVGPRAFRRDVLSEVLERAAAEGSRCADEVCAARLAGVPVAVHRVSEANILVTDAPGAELAGRLAVWR